MQLLRQLVRYTGFPLPLASVIVLTAFSVGYSLFITSLMSGGGSANALRFAGLNVLFGVLSSALNALVILVLARRPEWRHEALPQPRLGAIIGIVAGLFFVSRLVLSIWPIILVSTVDVSNDWFVTAYRLPSLPLQLILFPFIVWQVALARGASSPGLGEIWAEVWGRGTVLALVFLFAATPLGLTQLTQPLIGRGVLSQTAGLIVSVGPTSIATVLSILLAIVVYRDMNESASEAAVFR